MQPLEWLHDLIGVSHIKSSAVVPDRENNILPFIRQRQNLDSRRPVGMAIGYGVLDHDLNDTDDSGAI